MAANGAPAGLTQGSGTKGGIGESTLRPDGVLKVTGEFAYASDMWHEDMLWGQILCSASPWRCFLRFVARVAGVGAVDGSAEGCVRC
ncbi:hypothetical protein ABVB25_36165, partial [Streptomyces anthocyanicus]|uniref:hypothetical protein n=1 Tax=Streptomyces anthocyanicus TaxID=68174 RepID=UPI003369E287